MGETRQAFIDRNKALGWASGMIEGRLQALREVKEMIKREKVQWFKSHYPASGYGLDHAHIQAKLDEMITKMEQ